VAVLNGGGVQGAAAKAAAGLQRQGVQVVQTGNAPGKTRTSSTLAYPPDLQQEAKLLGYLLGDQVKLVKARSGQAASGVLVLTVGSSFRSGG
jgi:hypothetical protein